MSDSSGPDPPTDRRSEERIEGIRRWIAYVESRPPEVWGEQLNSLVNAQLEAARESGVSAEQYRRVDRAGGAYRARASDEETHPEG